MAEIHPAMLRRPRKLILRLVLLLSLSLSGCSYFLCAHMGDCGPWYNEQLEKSAIGWNSWLGKLKDQRIREFGLPDSCVKLETGEEVCEWRVSGFRGSGSYSGGSGSSHVASYEHRVTFTYDRDHIARIWNYRGDWGQANSQGNLGPGKTMGAH